MKKIILIGLTLIGSFAFAQSGLECIIVEKYYISNAADAAQADVESTDNGLATGALPVGSVTYRIYVDMLPGYKLLSLFAEKEFIDVNLVNPTLKAHPLKFITSTSFYNNPSGSYTPSSNKNAIKNKLLAIDSWFSLGGVATGNFGILKTEDNGLLNNVTSTMNTAQVLLNNNVAMGIPLTTQDGMIAGTGFPTPAFAGFTGAEYDVFGDGTVVGDSIQLTDGSVYTTAGATGPVADSTKVLVAQVTTDGFLSFELNVIIQNRTTLAAEFYVATDAQYDYRINMQQYKLSCLTYYPDLTVNTPNLKSSSQQFNVYPNPAKDLLTVEINNFKQNKDNGYTIYGILGNVILQKNLGTVSEQYRENIDISSLAKGLYFITLSADGVVSTKKVIKN